MSTPLACIADAGAFAALAFLGTRLARIVVSGAVPFDDGPVPGRPAVAAIVAAAASAGLAVAVRGAAAPELGMGCILAVALSAICYADVTCGLVPDVFTLAPLGAALASDALLRQWSGPISAALVAAPFGIAAQRSRGRGMGWGDVKLVALGAAVLGAQAALVAFALACFAAVGIAFFRKRHTPIAFAPYLVAAIGATAALRGIA
jgi:prepilin signal peptidase PulO-like enzyme (type II secretory pathway)